MGAYAIEGFATIAQKYISRGIASNFYAKSPTLYILAGKTAATTNEPLKIGRPGMGEVLSGAPVSNAEKMSLAGINSYAPRIQAFKTSNSKAMAARDTMPSVANPTTNSQGQAMQAAAEFRWFSIKTPMLIYHTDLDRCIDRTSGMGREGQGIAVGQLVEEATEVALQEHYDQLASRLLYGNPTSQDVDPWNDMLGLIPAVCQVTNIYGRVDRSALAAGGPWLPQVVTSFTSLDIQILLDTMNITNKCNVVGSGIDLMLVGGPNYIVLKKQILARGGVIVQNAGSMGLPSMAKYGIEREILRFDNCYIVHDPGLDTCYATDVNGNPLYTAQPGYIICLNTKVFKFMVHPKYNIKVKPFVDISDKSIGAPDADQGFIESQIITSCDKPSVCGVFTNVG